MLPDGIFCHSALRSFGLVAAGWHRHTVPAGSKRPPDLELRSDLEPHSIQEISVSTRHRLATIDEVAPGFGKECVVDGKIIALFNINGEFHAIDGLCAHAGGPLASGTVSGNMVTCPWHGWQYDIPSGQHCLTPTICQQSYAVIIDGDQVCIEL